MTQSIHAKVRSLIDKARVEALAEMDPEFRKPCEAFYASLDKAFDLIAGLIDDPDDANYALAMRYIALKATWIEYNTILNYQMATQGEPNAGLAQLAGVTSSTLGIIEPFVNQQAVERITQLLADPVKPG